MTVYEYILKFLTDYFLPAETSFPEWGNILIIIATVITLGIFWTWIIRPFWWFFKYGLWGNSKKNKSFKKWDD